MVLSYEVRTENMRIFNGYYVQIEKCVTKITVWPHEDLRTIICISHVLIKTADNNGEYGCCTI